MKCILALSFLKKIIYFTVSGPSCIIRDLSLQHIAVACGLSTWGTRTLYLGLVDSLPGARGLSTWGTRSLYLGHEDSLPGARALSTWGTQAQ